MGNVLQYAIILLKHPLIRTLPINMVTLPLISQWRAAGTNPVLGILCMLMLGIGLPLPLAAQPSLGIVSKPTKESSATSDGSSATVNVDVLEKQLSEAKAALAAIDSPERMAAGAPAGINQQQLQQRIGAMRLLVFALRQQINALSNLTEIKRIAADRETTRKSWSGLPEKPPYSILLVDKMRAELQSQMLDLLSEEIRLKISVAQTENAKEGLMKASERQRRAQDALESATPDMVPMATWLRDLAATEAKAQGAFLESLTIIRQAIDAHIAEFRSEADFSRSKISAAEKSVIFTAEDLAQLKSTIDEHRERVIKALNSAARDRDNSSEEVSTAMANHTAAEKSVLDLEARLVAVRKQLTVAEAAVAKAEKPDGVLEKINPFRGRSEKAELEKIKVLHTEIERKLANAQAFVQAKERDRQLVIERSKNAVLEVEKLNTSLVAYSMWGKFWEMRYAALEDQKKGVLDRRKLIENSRDLLKVLNPAREHLRAKLEVIVIQVADQQERLRTASTTDDKSYQATLLKLLTDRQENYLETTAEVEEIRNLLLRWMEEEDVRLEGLSAGERAKSLFGMSGDLLQTIWTFELFAVDDTIVVDGRTITGSRGVTVAKVVRAILIVIIGYLLIALLTRFVMNTVVRLGRMEETAARIARKWILAVTLVLLLLTALDVVKIPLTAFAFLGGAIAIGAGFGMQTLLKNLISGVMLLMERPFKPRDIIEVAGIRGEVTDINVRSCTIRDVNGIETLVPNSTFLEQNVTNWTLSSQKVRYTLNVGVGYGSPVRKVSDLLLEAAKRHNLVLKEPSPEVLFMDFGDNALMFALYVWLEIGPGHRSAFVVLSDLRFMIDTSFAEHGIAIPFPQRDVHFDASSPVPVRMMPPEEPADSKKK